MIVLGIDPGPERSGWCLYRRPSPHSPGQVEGAGVEPNEGLLGIFRLNQLPDALALEEPVHYRTATIGQSVLQTMRWAARFEQRFLDQSEREARVCSIVRWIPRPEVCGQLTGNRQAPKPAVRDFLVRYHKGGKGTKRAPGPLYGLASHSWDALAVALACVERLQNESPR